MSSKPNTPSNNPIWKKRKKVARELTELCREEGFEGLDFDEAFSPAPSKQKTKRQLLRKHRIVREAVEFGMVMPQPLIDEVFPPAEENPDTGHESDGKAPF